MILTIDAPEELVQLAPAAACIIYVGGESAPVDATAIAIGLDDALLVSLDPLVTDDSNQPLAPAMTMLAERLRCLPDRETLQRVLRMAQQRVAGELAAGTNESPATAIAPPKPLSPTTVADPMDALLREMDLAQSARTQAIGL